MFKRHNQLFTALRVLLDMLLVGAAFWAAYALRFGSPRTWPYPELPRSEETLIVAVLALIIWPLSLRAMGLYRPQRQKTPLDEVFGVFKATLVAGLLLVALDAPPAADHGGLRGHHGRREARSRRLPVRHALRRAGGVRRPSDREPAVDGRARDQRHRQAHLRSALLGALPGPPLSIARRRRHPGEGDQPRPAALRAGAGRP